LLQAIIKKGRVLVENVPTPKVSAGCVLIKVVNSCISTGTEAEIVSDTGKPLIKRALEQPEQVKQALEFAKSNGIQKTISRIRGKLDGGKPTGYSVAGVIVAMGAGVENFEVGRAVAAAGAGIANHAAYVDVPVNLVMKLPVGMDFTLASTAALGGIALQGVRRSDLKLGEFAVVLGGGILGLLAQQILQTSGIRTIVIDLDKKRLELAKQLGAEHILNASDEDIVQAVHNITGGYGADGVLFTAATGDSKPLSQAFQMCKKKGRVVLVGVSGMQLKREDMYTKELEFLISTSYGPGRYDESYEEKGVDYPYAYVRWTENRNMEEYLRLVHAGKIQVKPLISDVFPIERVEEAFEKITSKSRDKAIITILDYGVKDIKKAVGDYQKENSTIQIQGSPLIKRGVIQVALIGAGNFATGTHLPNLQRLSSKFRLRGIVSSKGHKAKAVANQFKAVYATTDYDEILQDSDIDLILITTRHNNHARLSLQALQAGKHVFVEKPLATNPEELEPIKSFYSDSDDPKPILMVGFNRRFSKYARAIKEQTSKRVNPLFIQYRMNAGYVSLDHWQHKDGGRIIGECCHLIDLMTFFTESELISISSESLSPLNKKFSNDDNRSIVLKYRDGSICNINYLAVGNKKLPKEYMEVHFDEKSIVMTDYKRLQAYGLSLKNVSSSISQKGQFEELNYLYDALSGKTKKWPIELWDMVQTTEATFAIKEMSFT
jgi:predicted dehydrogenase/threonine dehydrogenase-like Zn-dependent dehydrogenase